MLKEKFLLDERIVNLKKLKNLLCEDEKYLLIEQKCLRQIDYSKKSKKTNKYAK